MLLEKLRLKQGELSDYKFADKLGVSHQLWQMTRTGKREVGLTVLQGTIRAYPELSRDVLFFLQGNVVSPSVIGEFPTDGTQNAHDGKLGRFGGWLRDCIKRVFSSKANQATKSKSRE